MKETPILNLKRMNKNKEKTDVKYDQLFMKKQFAELARKNLSIAINLFHL
ncbi:MAG: hypothetical protein ACEQSA_04235 [Weeksellaceae bacterium]